MKMNRNITIIEEPTFRWTDGDCSVETPEYREYREYLDRLEDTRKKSRLFA